MRAIVVPVAAAFLLAAAVAVAYPPATITDVTQSSVRIGGLDCGTRYQVRIREFRSGAFQDTTTQEVTTAACPPSSPPPVAAFTVSPDPAVRTQATAFTSTGTCPSTPCTYRWFHDTQTTGEFATGTPASFTFTNSGVPVPAGTTRTVTLRVTDTLGRAAASTKTFGLVEPTVDPPPPTGDWPDASNTGVPPFTALTPRSGIFVTQPGTVIDSVDAPFVWVQADNVTVRNSYIHGDQLVSVYNDGGHTGLLVEDSTLAAADGSCLWGANTIGRRLDISGCENGAEGDDNLTLVDSWIHDLNTANDAHTDGVQFPPGAGNVLIRHNTINPQDTGTPATTSAIIMCESCSTPPHDVRIENNKLNGDHASVSLYCPGLNTTGVYIVGNRMTRGVYGQYTASCTAGHYTEFSGNVDDVSGAPVPPGN